MINKITHTKSARATINYLFKEEAHNTKLVSERNLDYKLHNLTKSHESESADNVDIDWLSGQFSTVKSFAKNKKKKTEGHHVIISFSKDDFDLSDINNQSKQALFLTHEFFKDYLDDDCQFVSTVQLDNDSHNLHVHTLINSVKIDGKTLSTDKFRQLGKDGFRENIDTFMLSNFERVTNRQFKPVEKSKDGKIRNYKSAFIKKRDGYVWKEDLQNRIDECLQDLTDSNEAAIADSLRERGIEISKRKASIGKDENGKKIYREAYTYVFVDDSGTERKSRDFNVSRNGKKTGLGERYTPENVKALIEQNKLRNEQKIASEREKAIEQDKIKNEQKLASEREKMIERERNSEIKKIVELNKSLTEDFNSYRNESRYSEYRKVYARKMQKSLPLLIDSVFVKQQVKKTYKRLLKELNSLYPIPNKTDINNQNKNNKRNQDLDF